MPGSDFAMQKVAKALGKEKKYAHVFCAFLEISEPSIPDAIESAFKKGASEIKLVPYFVHIGRHVSEDIPKIASLASKKYPKVKIKLCPYLGYDEKLVEIVRKRLEDV